MGDLLRTSRTLSLILLSSCAVAPATSDRAQQWPGQSATSVPPTTLANLEVQLRAKGKAPEYSTGMRLAFHRFLSTHKLQTNSVNYSDFVLIRLFFEATRDAGLWNLHWAITDQPPNSDRIWQQWKVIHRPSVLTPTATAECDELSALYAFLVQRAGVRSVGLLWPYANHTVAVWMVPPANGAPIRVVVPTTQIFLDEHDFFDTPKFNPWRQKNIYEYMRRDVPDSFELPKPLFDFFLSQVDKYAGASDDTLQQLRYIREAVLSRKWTPEQAAREALKKGGALAAPASEDLAAFQVFAVDMRTEPPAF